MPNAAQTGVSILHSVRNLDIRSAIMIGLIMTYLWRFQDLAAILEPFRLALLVSVAAIVVLGMDPNWRVLGRALKRPYIVLFLIWSAWIGIGVPFAIDTRNSWSFWTDHHLKAVVMIVFVLSTLGSLAAIRLALAAHLLGVSLITYFYVKSGFPIAWTPLVGVDRNDLALMFNLATPMIVFFALTEPTKWIRWAAWGLAATVAISTILTQSRGGFLTVAVVIVFLSFRVENILWYRRLIPIAALGLGLVLMPADVKERLETILATEEDYNRTQATGRVPIWTRGIGYMLDHPVSGVGGENFGTAEATLALEARTLRNWRALAPHNIFVQVGAETGFVGLGIYLAMIMSTLLALNRSRRRMLMVGAPQTWVLFADLVSASLIAFCVGGFFLSWGYSSFLFFFMALTAGYQFCEEAFVARGRPQRPKRPRRRRKAPVARGPVLGI